MITQIAVMGERCSGTNFLQSAIASNFAAGLTWEYGWKHFFGFSDYKDSDNTLFVAIVRDPHTWINSLFKQKWHLQPELKTEDIDTFLNSEFWSYNDGVFHHMILDCVKCVTKEEGAEIMEDRNMYTGERYRNIFDCRKTKCQFLMDTMPTKVKHYVLIRYEDLRDHYIQTLEMLRDTFHLPTHDSKYFPVMIDTYKGTGQEFKESDPDYIIPRDKIWSHPDLDVSIESKLAYGC